MRLALLALLVQLLFVPSVYAQSATVTVPFILSGPSSVQFQVVGCGATPSVFNATGSAKVVNVQMQQNCQYLLGSADPDVAFLLASGAKNEIIATSCSSGVCPPVSVTDSVQASTLSQTSSTKPTQTAIVHTTAAKASYPILPDTGILAVVGIFALVIVLGILLVAYSRGGE